MANEGLLFVLGETGSNVSEEEFNVWYDTDHAPARLTVPGFKTALRYRATDGQKPTWLAIYDLTSPEVAYSEAYKSLGTNASEYERNLVSKLELLNRRVYTSIQGQKITKPDIDESSIPGKYLFVAEVTVPPAAEEEFNAWYREGHLRDATNPPACYRGRRFKLDSSIELTGKADKSVEQPNYVAIYEWDHDLYFEDPEFQAALSTPRTQEVVRKVSIRPRRFVLHKEFKRRVE